MDDILISCPIFFITLSIFQKGIDFLLLCGILLMYTSFPISRKQQIVSARQSPHLPGTPSALFGAEGVLAAGKIHHDSLRK
ncbi:MAG: hypothetical protein MR763_06080 [Clostridiales bacterium]|nr:hypothetical protein [Clostridiales bacterium]